jgi:hypothetical protein
MILPLAEPLARVVDYSKVRCPTVANSSTSGTVRNYGVVKINVDGLGMKTINMVAENAQQSAPGVVQK